VNLKKEIETFESEDKLQCLKLDFNGILAGGENGFVACFQDKDTLIKWLMVFRSVMM